MFNECWFGDPWSLGYYEISLVYVRQWTKFCVKISMEMTSLVHLFYRWAMECLLWLFRRIYREWYMYSSDELFQCSWKGYFGVYFPCCKATREINTKITLDIMKYICIIYININNTRSLHILPIAHSLSFRSADDVTIDCWWHHNDQTIMTQSHE